MHRDAKVANARLAHNTGETEISLHRSRQASQVRLGDWRHRGGGKHVTLDVPVVLCPEAVWSLAQESERNACQNDGVGQCADHFASVHEETMTSIDRTTAQTPTAHHRRGQINSEAAVARGAAPPRHSAPNVTEMGCVSCGRSAQPKGLCSPQEVDQTVDDEQSGEGRHHACSRARRGAAPARRSASRLSSRRESRRIIAIPGEASAQ